MKTVIVFSCLLACAVALPVAFPLPAFNYEAYLGGPINVIDDPSEVSRSFSFKVDLDFEALQKAVAEFEANLAKEDRFKLEVPLDMEAFQQAYNDFINSLKSETADRALDLHFDADAYHQMLEELAKIAKEALP